MSQCRYCNEESVHEYFDSYDNEVYMKCRLCGRTAAEPVCALCGDEITDDGYVGIQKDIYCTECYESITENEKRKL
ncbi:MAG: hypothetical protein IKK53_07840 [Ruminiclostridium sp.]|nr:hypothetical protein [Ruminiclostridium sp.]